MNLKEFNKHMADLNEYRTAEREAAKFVKLLRENLTKHASVKNRAVKLGYEQMKKRLGVK